ncbi:Uma2 family endonuclease [Lachnospiraceae bacterium 46-15]
MLDIRYSTKLKKDFFTKLFKYRTVGVREYWIVDPDKNRVTVYNFETEDTLEYSFSDSIQGRISRGGNPVQNLSCLSIQAFYWL